MSLVVRVKEIVMVLSDDIQAFSVSLSFDVAVDPSPIAFDTVLYNSNDIYK